MTKVRNNYGKKSICPLCMNREDNQEKCQNVLNCNAKNFIKISDEKYDDIFSSDINKISKISKIFQKCFETREEFLAQD